MNFVTKISIITPNFNGAQFLEETILSVLDQNYPNLEYIVIDGGSTDGSIDIIRKYESKLAFWISEPDKGMYYAIQKGFEKSTGEIMGWINSDDKLIEKSLFILAEIFAGNTQINWIQGYPTVIDELSRIVLQRPHRYKREQFLSKAFLDGNFIQQESTYWRRSLWELAGAKVSTEYKYAGDFELWTRFFNFDKLYITNAIIGSFRVRKSGQISKVFYKEYLAECIEIINKDYENLSVFAKIRIVGLRIIDFVNRITYYSKIIHAIVAKRESRFVRYDFSKEEFVTNK